MKLLADQDIPLVEHYFGSSFDIILKAGRTIQPADLIDIDMLIVRAVTRVDQTLLGHSSVSFVGSVTSGADHLDRTWLTRAGIEWRIAKGCNAMAVVEYVICVIAVLNTMGFLAQEKPRAAVIGVGEIGSKVVSTLTQLGFDVLQCDPLRAQQEPDFPHTPFEKIEQVDLISFHVPLTRDHDYSTYHLVNKRFLQQQQSNCVLINTSRGDIIPFSELKRYGQHLLWCLDVFEDEPDIDLAILQQALIATPHIAGYSVQSKHRGIHMIYEAAVQAQKMLPLLQDVLPMKRKIVSLDSSITTWQKVVLQLFNPLEMTERMRQQLLAQPKSFDLLRKRFTDRYEFQFVDIFPNPVPIDRLNTLGFNG